MVQLVQLSEQALRSTLPPPDGRVPAKPPRRPWPTGILGP
jgi:hypothetical protein